MSLYRNPTIRSIGAYTASTPFDAVIIPEVMYRCHSIRTIQEMMADGDEPFKTIYEPIGLSYADFELDLSEGVNIISLEYGGQSWVYIPNKYLTSYPMVSGEVYQSKALSVNLGPLPSNIVLASLVADIEAMVTSTIGVSANVSILETSPEVLLSYVDHDADLVARTANIVNNTSYKDKYEEQLVLTNSNAVQIAGLEEYIIDNHTP